EKLIELEHQKVLSPGTVNTLITNRLTSLFELDELNQVASGQALVTQVMNAKDGPLFDFLQNRTHGPKLATLVLTVGIADEAKPSPEFLKTVLERAKQIDNLT